jgi:hypothetical protein
MELKVYSPTEDQFITDIKFNHEEIKQELAVRLEKYRGLVYTEDTIKEAKTDRASLNKFKDAIETRRKEIKKACLKPYEDFESKVKEIVAMIDEPIKAIDDQVKNFEQIKKDEKLSAIKQFFLDKVDDLEKLVSFEKVYNAKWLNVTYKETDIYKEITELLDRVRSDLEALNALETPNLMQLKDFYLKDFDLTATLQEKKRLEEQAAKLAEYKRQQEEKARQQQEEAKTVVIDENHGFENCKPGDRVVFGGNPVTASELDLPPQLITVDFRVQASREQLAALKQFLADNGIKYGRVPTCEPERRAI